MKNVRNIHGEVLLLVKFQAKACNFIKSNDPPCVFFTFFKLCKGYQIQKRISFLKLNCTFPALGHTCVNFVLFLYLFFCFLLYIHLSHPKTEDLIRVICMSAFILENNSPHSFLISLEPNTMILMLSDRYIKWKKHTV